MTGYLTSWTTRHTLHLVAATGEMGDDIFIIFGPRHAGKSVHGYVTQATLSGLLCEQLVTSGQSPGRSQEKSGRDVHVTEIDNINHFYSLVL